MALVTLYFGVTASGSGDGSTPSNCLALFNDGVWSTAITGFDFGSDHLRAMILSGSYSLGQMLANAIFTVQAPTRTNPLFLIAAKSDGSMLEPSNPGWTPAQPCWDESEMPVMVISSNKVFIDQSFIYLWMIKAVRTASATTSLIGGIAGALFCVGEQQANQTGGCIFSGASSSVTNSLVLRWSGTTMTPAADIATSFVRAKIRVEGNASATTGDRRGFLVRAISTGIELVAINCPGGGIVVNSSLSFRLNRFVAYNCASGGVLVTNGTAMHQLSNGIMVGGMYGVDAGGYPVLVSNIRARHNTTANFANFDTMPTDLGNYTDADASQAVDDAAEFVNAGTAIAPDLMDLRVKAGSAIWGKGFGVEDEPASSGGGEPGGTIWTPNKRGNKQ